MKKTIYLIAFSLLFINCSKKEVKIPTLSIKGIQEIHNHSQVWMFFEEKDNDTIANLNRKNTIVTTHWIFNIDKRLPLRTITPTLIKLQYKHANGMHSKDGMHNYFSFSDTLSKKLSFFEFDRVVFKTDSLLSKSYIKTNSKGFENYFNVNITINPKNNWINDAKMENGELKTTLTEFIDFSSEGKQTMLHLNFNQDLLYQDYLDYLTLLHSLKTSNIIINDLQFIFDPNKVPDCGCQ